MGPGVLVVDVANVVGSRPDGWWRDRVGATQRLLERLALLPEHVVAVVEGTARGVDDAVGVRVVRADGSGDDTVVEEAGRHPGAVVVTADRGLRARLPEGTAVVGPGVLLARIDPGTPSSEDDRATCDERRLKSGPCDVDGGVESGAQPRPGQEGPPCEVPPPVRRTPEGHVPSRPWRPSSSSAPRGWPLRPPPT